MARSKTRIIQDALAELGFQSGDSTQLDRQVELAYTTAVRSLSNRPWAFSRVRGMTLDLVADQAVYNLPKDVALVDTSSVYIASDGKTNWRKVEWMEAVLFDREIANPAQKGGPKVFTSEEYDERRIVRFWPVPNVAYDVRYAFYRNIEFQDDETVTSDSDSLVIPGLMEDLVIAKINLELCKMLYGNSAQDLAQYKQIYNDRIEEIEMLLPVDDLGVSVEPPDIQSYEFDEGP